jgi:TatD DNase family protein
LLTDSHTHLDQFPPVEIPEVIGRAVEAGVGLIICAGTTLTSSKACIEMTKRYPVIYAGVGLHPMDLKSPLDDATYREMAEMALSNPKVVCVSEVGLDFLPTSPPREVQYQALRRQIGLAREIKKPIIFHSRESHLEMIQVLREERAEEIGGVMHYFQGDAETARQVMELGFYISLAKPLLRLPELQEVAKALPMERIVLETDCYPQPFKKYRHSWTEPHHVRMVAEKLGEIKGMEVEEVAEATTRNLLGLLGLRERDYEKG